MLQFFGAMRTTAFVGGAIVGAVGAQVLKSETVRNVAVAGMAKGYMMKDSMMEYLANMKEEADDICAEAKAKAQKASCDCGCDCTCEETQENSDDSAE